MNTDQLRHDLRDLGERARPPSSGLADDVVRLRRRQRDRRVAVLAAGVGVALVVALVPVLGTLGGSRGGAADGATFTRGSLAGDTAFLDALREVPWTYQQWHSPDGTGVTMDPQRQPAEGWTSAVTDLAAGYRPDQRDVVFAGDVPGGRWALVALDSAGADTMAWFTGPAGATADQLRISGMPQTVSAGDPLAHVDLADPMRSLVVVASPGDQVEISQRAELAADGTIRRTYEPVPDEDGDGVVTAVLGSSTRFGVAASISVRRGGDEVWRAGPSTAGTAAGIDRDDPRGWPIAIDTRTGTGSDPGLGYLDEALTTALGPFGVELEDLTGDGGGELTEVFQGSGTGRTGAPALITVYSIRMPSGARLLVGGYTTTPGSPGGEDIRPDMGVPYLEIRPADDPVDGDLVAADVDTGTRTLVVSGPVGSVEAAVLGADGRELTRVDLTDGVASLRMPSGATHVQLLDQDGAAGQARPISDGRTRSWGDYGSSTTSSFSIPIPPPA